MSAHVTKIKCRQPTRSMSTSVGDCAFSRRLRPKGVFRRAQEGVYRGQEYISIARAQVFAPRALSLQVTVPETVYFASSCQLQRGVLMGQPYPPIKAVVLCDSYTNPVESAWAVNATRMPAQSSCPLHNRPGLRPAHMW